jgi:hypothetical protein
MSTKDVTLVAVETRGSHSGMAGWAVEHCRASTEFRDTVIISSSDATGRLASAPNRFVRVDTILHHEDVCAWWLTELPGIVAGLDTGSHLLFVAWDGYVVNPDAWDDDWLQYDFVGAPWPDGVVGNNGFSLASRRYFEAIASLDIEPTRWACNPCDRLLAMDAWQRRRGYRSRLDASGVRFAAADVARRFSVENEKYQGSYGFHGVNTLRTIRPEALYQATGRSSHCER